MTALQRDLFSLLSGGQTTPVYDDVNEKEDDQGNKIPVTLPYINFGAFTCKKSGDKTSDLWDISQLIHIWSEYDGKAEVNEIANDITTVLSSAGIDLSADHFNVISQEVDFFEAFPEEEFGYHGVITLVCKIQNLGG